MMQKRMAFAVVSGIALAFAVGVAVGQNAPAENRGVSPSAPTSVDLSNEIDGVAGRQLRMRIITIEPGGAVAMHSHKGRPAVAYALQGTLVEHLEDGTVHEHAQGTTWTEANGISHWAENKSDQPIKVLAVDVFKP
ncbi:MAG: cupin domain-containing protein [Betaproteobacteria bacterium]